MPKSKSRIPKRATIDAVPTSERDDSAFVMAIASILMFTSLLHQFYLAVGVLTGKAGGPPAGENPAAASGDQDTV